MLRFGGRAAALKLALALTVSLTAFSQTGSQAQIRDDGRVGRQPANATRRASMRQSPHIACR